MSDKFWPSNAPFALASLSPLGTRCWLTNHSTGRYTACLALARHFILGQTQSCRSAPVSSNVRPHNRDQAMPSSQSTQKTCSICGVSKPIGDFTYGNRENRSYCPPCSKAEKSAYVAGGTEAARSYRESMRKQWKSSKNSAKPQT